MSLVAVFSETVAADLVPSRWGARFVDAAAVASSALVVAMPLAPVAGIAFLAWILVALRRARRVHFAARRVIVDRSKSIRICDAASHWQSGFVQDGSFVAPWLTIVRWRPEGAWFDRTVLVLPDMIDPEDFRLLRVLLRWG